MIRRFWTTIATLAMALMTWLCLCAHPAAAQGPPPSWDQVVEQSELIVRARVVEPGRVGARVQVEETFYGTAPSEPFLVIGFSDGAMPPEIVEEEAMRRDEVVWLFLQRWQGMRWGVDIPVWRAEGWAPVPGEAWNTPSPIAGDVPMRDGQARVRLAFGGYHHLAPPMAQADWESLLRALIHRVKDDRLDTAAIERTRACLDEGPVPPGLPVDEPPDLRCLAMLRLLGDTSGDPRLLDYAHGSPAVVGAAAGLGAHSEDPRFDALIRAAALHESPDAGLFLVSFAEGGGEARVARALAPLLAASRGTSDYEEVSLVRLRDETMRTRILTILVSAPHADAKAALLDELPYLNPDLLFIGIDALEAIDPGSWVPGALALLDDGELQRSKVVLEMLLALKPASAREGLHAYIERDDVDPGLIRMGIEALGAVGDESTARLLRGRLERRLAFETSWHDDRVDMVAVELAALQSLDGSAAADLAWLIARQYLGQPRAAAADPAFRADMKREAQTLTAAVERALPPGSSATIRVVTEREDAFEARGTRLVLVHAEASAGVTEALRTEVARVAGTAPEHVKLCGPDPRGRVRCIRDRGSFWEPHGRLIKPVLEAIGASAGLTDRPAEQPDAHAGYWLALARASTWLDKADAVHLADDLWLHRFYGPIDPERDMPLLPPGLGPFDESLPSRSR